MSAPVILLMAQRGLFKRPLKRTGTWLILEKRDGWWTIQSESNFKPGVIPPGGRLVREYR